MDLEVLTEKFYETHQKWEKKYKKAEAERKRVNAIIINIRGCVKKDFENFLNNLNPRLQYKQKITKWKIEDEPRGYIYSNGMTYDLGIYIEIKEIGSKPCVGACDASSLPVPDYLKNKLKNFTERYSFPIRIWLDNSNWESDANK
ncbi:MAG: hypothetical protein PHH54_03655 [Candidatus Nanoarchaeia archaeon]|nr:hypothetical protein [Candidatus Nanoarchaeia archaeon]MDD5741054.1 hypothetical protein [Candidatus Nanoarchaeia archaeon]